jgi:hypothetical protein
VNQEVRIGVSHFWAPPGARCLPCNFRPVRTDRSWPRAKEDVKKCEATDYHGFAQVKIMN